MSLISLRVELSMSAFFAFPTISLPKSASSSKKRSSIASGSVSFGKSSLTMSTVLISGLILSEKM